MAAVWPVSLPAAPKLAGLALTPGDRTVRTQMDAGPAKVRSRFSVAPDKLPVTLDLTDAQRATFQTFFTTTLVNGSLPFTWTHPLTGAAQDWRFLGPPTFALLVPRTGPAGEIRCRVSFSVETMTS